MQFDFKCVIVDNLNRCLFKEYSLRGVRLKAIVSCMPNDYSFLFNFLLVLFQRCKVLLLGC